jgi:hypothetical protein
MGVNGDQMGSGKSACSLKDPKIGKPQHHHHHHHPYPYPLHLPNSARAPCARTAELEDGDSDERLEGAPGIWFLMCLQNRLIFDIKIASASFSSFSDLNMLNPLKIVKQCLATAGRLGGLEETQIRSQLGFLLPVGSFPLFFGIT